MLAKKTSKNQLTLPKEIVESFGGTTYFDVTTKGGKIILAPVKIVPNVSLESLQKKLKQLGVTEEDVKHAVRWARKRNA